MHAKWVRRHTAGAAVWAIVALTGASQAEEDPWFGADKAKHFGASATIAAGGYGLGAAVFDDRASALALGGGLALGAGIGKEVYDATGRGSASERDLVWDVAGTATGLGVAWLLDLLLRDELESPRDPPTRSVSTGLCW